MGMTSVSEVIKPPPTSVGFLGWLRKNLFSTWYNALLTLAALWLIYTLLVSTIKWALTQANWGVITANLRLFMVGQFPPEQVWRVGACVLLTVFLFGLSWGVWGGMVRDFVVALAAGFAVLALLPFAWDVRLWLLANLALVLGGYPLGRILSGRKLWVMAGWALSFPITIILLSGFRGSAILPLVDTNLWGGLLLTFLLSIIGIVASFPLGVLLAVGRQSTMPTIKLFCVLFIELVRGVPLVTVLFMAQIMLPLFLPEGLRIDRVIRAMVGITLFSAAYMAENVRGGLQAIPWGQIEAARALGLSGPLTMLLIVLPQALRAVIPAIVGLFISLFKDTSLVAIAGLLELLNIGHKILAQPEWMGLQKEVYAFVAVIYFIFSYAMSYASRRLEVYLGVGER
ncbi:MAG: amino acid ABC transporter permease [Anaerolineae bacterium]